MKKLLLASSSTHRKALLQKLGMDFESCAPDIDESRLPNELPEAMVKRLAIKKACHFADQYPHHLIIGSDQVAHCLGEILGKPGNFDTAFEQLCKCRGRVVEFLTGLCLYNPGNGQIQSSVETYQVTFRELSDRQIIYYLNSDKPFDCAGSFKSEGLGISLFSSMKGEDPNSLVGLPLIALIRMLNKEGIDPLY